MKIKSYIIYKVCSCTKYFQIEEFFNKMSADILILDVSCANILTSDFLSLIMINKERIFLYRPTDRILTIIKLLSGGSFFKILKEIPVDLVPYSDKI